MRGEESENEGMEETKFMEKRSKMSVGRRGKCGKGKDGTKKEEEREEALNIEGKKDKSVKMKE